MPPYTSLTNYGNDSDGIGESVLDSVADDGASDPMSLTLGNEVDRLLGYVLEYADGSFNTIPLPRI